MPRIGYSASGGLDLGIAAGIGVPGLGASVSLGYSFKSQNISASLGASAGIATAYISYGTKSGLTSGLGMGFSLVPGISSNITSMDISYGRGGVSSSVMGFSPDGDGGMRFNPSIGYGYGINFSRKQVPVYADATLSACTDCPTVLGPDIVISANKQVLIGYDMKWGIETGTERGIWDNSKLALDIGGGIYGALQTAVNHGDKWLGKNGKYYNTS
jgi:hypothetical protein